MQKQLFVFPFPVLISEMSPDLLKMLSSAIPAAGNEGLPTQESHCHRGRQTAQVWKGSALSNQCRAPLPMLPHHFETLMAPLFDFIEESQLIKGYWRELLQTIAMQSHPFIATRQWLAEGNPVVMHGLAWQSFCFPTVIKKDMEKECPKPLFLHFLEAEVLPDFSKR